MQASGRPQWSDGVRGRGLRAAAVCVLLGIVVFTVPKAVSAQGAADPAHPCGNPFVNHFGPWDYRTASKPDKDIVERAHFTPGIETMTRPSNTMMHDMAQDVAYTLGVFPNHHRALLTMERLSEKHKSDPPPGTQRPLDCWYYRAITFSPNDTVARALYARFLAKKGRRNEAVAQLDTAVGHATDNPLSHYNLGLIYFEIGQHDKALTQAHRAFALGLQRQDLARQLKGVGKWTEPAGEAAAAPASAASR